MFKDSFNFESKITSINRSSVYFANGSKLSLKVPSTKNGSCGIYANRLLESSTSKSSNSTSPILILPVGWFILSIDNRKLLLPEPVLPTIAILAFWISHENDTWFKTYGKSSRYLTLRLLTDTLLFIRELKGDTFVGFKAWSKFSSLIFNIGPSASKLTYSFILS